MQYATFMYRADNGCTWNISDQHVTTEQKLRMRNITITCMTAYKGVLWIGTSGGCILTLPLPRLEGVPQIKGTA